MRRGIAVLVSAVMLATGACSTDDQPDDDTQTTIDDTQTTIELPADDLDTLPVEDNE